jgi:hypothetical protein
MKATVGPGKNKEIAGFIVTSSGYGCTNLALNFMV